MAFEWPPYSPLCPSFLFVKQSFIFSPLAFHDIEMSPLPSFVYEILAFLMDLIIYFPRIEVRHALHLSLSSAHSSMMLFMLLRHSFNYCLPALWVISCALSVLIGILSFRRTGMIYYPMHLGVILQWFV